MTKIPEHTPSSSTPQGSPSIPGVPLQESTLRALPDSSDDKVALYKQQRIHGYVGTSYPPPSSYREIHPDRCNNDVFVNKNNPEASSHDEDAGDKCIGGRSFSGSMLKPVIMMGIGAMVGMVVSFALFRRIRNRG